MGCLVSSAVAVETNVFTAADGSFHEASNWSLNAVPDSTVKAYVSDGNTVRISSDATVGKLGIGVTGNGTAVQTGGNVRIGSSLGGQASFFLSGSDVNGSDPNAGVVRNALYHLSGGTVDVESYCHIGQFRGANYSSEGVLRITGGSFITRNWTAVGRFYTESRGHLIVEDAGTMTVTRNGLNIGEGGNGTMTVKNGGSLTVNGPLTFAADGSNGAGRGYVTAGGQVTAAKIQNAGKGAQKGLFVDGGILSSDCTAFIENATYQNSWISGLPAFNVGTRGVTFDTAGRSVRVPQAITVADVPERLTTENLVHRWSFNGDLSDSVGAQAATANNAHFMDFAAVVIPGGAKNTGYVSLGSNILPKDGSGVTLEIWATQLSAQSYSRVFEIGQDKWATMGMSWSTGTDIARDRIGLSVSGLSPYEKYDGGATGPYTLGIQYHIAWVFTPPTEEGGAWSITVYKHDAMTGELLASDAYTPQAGWTLPTAHQENCWLGHSTYGDNDASAAYDEVRVWNKALTEEELSSSVRLGPDTTFGTPGAIVKRGAGRLELPSVTGARDVVVQEGTLAAGTGGVTPLVHRWTFNNGDLRDKVGNKDGWVVAPTDSSKAIVTNSTSLRLAGGTRGTAGHIELGSNILPSDGSPLTIELWATQHGAGSWSRVFEIGSSWTNSFLFTWTRGTTLGQNRIEGTDGMTGSAYRMVYRIDDTLAPFSLDTEYHLAVTMSPDAESGRWRVTAYKQDAVTGETLAKGTALAEEGWSPARLIQKYAYLGYSISSSDLDANASYNEVRVWSAALTEEQLAKNARLGPDSVCYYPVGEGTASLPASARLDVRDGAFLDLCGGTATATALTGEGTVQNGTLTLTGGVRPGNGGVSGSLKLADGAVLNGTLVIRPSADGACGSLEADGALDLSGIDLALDDESDMKSGVKYLLATCAPGQPINAFRSVPERLEGSIKYDTSDGRVTCKLGGLIIFVK